MSNKLYASKDLPKWDWLVGDEPTAWPHVFTPSPFDDLTCHACIDAFSILRCQRPIDHPVHVPLFT